MLNLIRKKVFSPNNTGEALKKYRKYIKKVKLIQDQNDT